MKSAKQPGILLVVFLLLGAAARGSDPQTTRFTLAMAPIEQGNRESSF